MDVCIKRKGLKRKMKMKLATKQSKNKQEPNNQAKNHIEKKSFFFQLFVVNIWPYIYMFVWFPLHRRCCCFLDMKCVSGVRTTTTTTITKKMREAGTFHMDILHASIEKRVKSDERREKKG